MRLLCCTWRRRTSLHPSTAQFPYRPPSCSTAAGIECMANTKVCMLCHRDRTPAYNATSGRITACKPATTVGATCRTRSRDAECARCDASNWCFQCSLDKYFDANWNCVPNGATKGTCKQVSRNPDCLACNPGGQATCRHAPAAA
jgi:hypothetical protein